MEKIMVSNKQTPLQTSFLLSHTKTIGDGKAINEGHSWEACENWGVLAKVFLAVSSFLLEKSDTYSPGSRTWNAHKALHRDPRVILCCLTKGPKLHQATSWQLDEMIAVGLFQLNYPILQQLVCLCWPPLNPCLSRAGKTTSTMTTSTFSKRWQNQCHRSLVCLFFSQALGQQRTGDYISTGMSRNSLHLQENPGHIPTQTSEIKFSFERRTAILETDPYLQLLGQILGSPHMLCRPPHSWQDTRQVTHFFSTAATSSSLPSLVLKVKTFLKVLNWLLGSKRNSVYIWLDHFHAVANVAQSLPWQMQNGRKGMIPEMMLELDLPAPASTRSLELVCSADTAECTPVIEGWLKGVILGWWADAESCDKAEDGWCMALIHTKDSQAGHSKQVLEKQMSEMTWTEVF